MVFVVCLYNCLENTSVAQYNILNSRKLPRPVTLVFLLLRVGRATNKCSGSVFAVALRKKTGGDMHFILAMSVFKHAEAMKMSSL